MHKGESFATPSRASVAVEERWRVWLVYCTWAFEMLQSRISTTFLLIPLWQYSCVGAPVLLPQEHPHLAGSFVPKFRAPEWLCTTPRPLLTTSPSLHVCVCDACRTKVSRAIFLFSVAITIANLFSEQLVELQLAAPLRPSFFFLAGTVP